MRRHLVQYEVKRGEGARRQAAWWGVQGIGQPQARPTVLSTATASSSDVTHSSHPTYNDRRYMLKLAIVQSGHANVPAIYQLVALQPLALLYTLRHKKKLHPFTPPPTASRRSWTHYVFMSSVRACVRPSGMSFPRYLWYALTIFHQTFVSSASWDKDELIRFLGSNCQRSSLTGDGMHSSISSNHL